MASKGFMGKGKKKKEKGTDWLEAGVQGGAILLALVKEAAEFAPIPYLKIAAGTTLKIVTTVQAVKDNKADYQRLAQDATEIIAVVWRSYQKAGDPTTWPQDKAEMVADLVTTLHMILGHVEDQVKRSRTMRVIYSVADTVKIKEYRERLQAAISKFEVSSHLTMQDVLFQLLKGQQDITARLDNHGQSTPLVIQLHLDEERAKAKAKEEAEEAAEKKRIVEMEKVKAERDAALKEKLKMEELREDIDRQRKEQEKIAAEIKRWKEQQEEEAELARLKEAQRLREEKRLKEENERRAKLAKALEEEREEEAKRVEAERPKASAEEEKRRLEKAAALQKKIESRRAKESDSLSPKSKSSKPPVIEISSDEDDEDDDESWEDDSESEYESSEDEAMVQARLEEERKARKAAKKKGSSAPSITSPEAAMHNAFAQIGLNPGGGGSSSGYPSPPASPYPGYPPYGGHSPYYGPPGMHPGMLSPPSLSTNNSGNVTNMNMSNIGNDNSIRYYGSKRSKKVTR